MSLRKAAVVVNSSSPLNMDLYQPYTGHSHDSDDSNNINTATNNNDDDDDGGKKRLARSSGPSNFLLSNVQILPSLGFPNPSFDNTQQQQQQQHLTRSRSQESLSSETAYTAPVALPPPFVMQVTAIASWGEYCLDMIWE
jgi:hypothetical protein